MSHSRWSVLQPTAVNRVLDEVRALQARGQALVSLMRGQPDLPTPPQVIEAAEQALRSGRTGYPDNRGEPALRRAVTQRLKRDHGLDYDPEREILITNGATGGLFVALGALLEPGDEVLLPAPIYDAYTGPIQVWGGKPVFVPPTIEDGRFAIDRQALARSRSKRTRAILLNTPWNPVGTVFRADELREIVQFAAGNDLYLVSDEIYETLTFDGKQHVSPASLSDEARARTILINSFSKTYSMTGWRVGYCAAAAEVIDRMLLLWQQFSRGPATFIQDAAVAALSLGCEYHEAVRREYQNRRDTLLAGLRGIDGVVPLSPEGGFFVMLDVRGLGMSSDQVRRKLLEAGVVVLHGAAYGLAGEGLLRVSFAAGGDVLHKGMERLREALAYVSRSQVTIDDGTRERET